MRRPSPAVLGSVALHLGVAALAFFSWPERNPEDPKPLVSSVPVSIISETEIAAAAPDWAALRTLPDEDVTQTLVALPGIGRWTAEIYLKFALGRADAFAAGDLALQEAARMMFDLPARPTPAALIAMAEPWRPWRSVAARALWAYYGTAKGREGVR